MVIADFGTAEFQARDGTRLPAPPRARRALGRALTSEETLDRLVAHGLVVARGHGQVRVRVSDLRAALVRVVREEPETIDGPMRELLRILATMGEQDAHEIAVPTECGPRLSLVPAPAGPRDVVLGMQQVAPEGAAELLEALDGMLGDITLAPELLRRTLVPLLTRPGVAGLAARILSRAGVTDACADLERSLSHTTAPADRLEILAALMRLGHRALALRTFRTILIHSAEDVRRLAVRRLAEVADAGDSDALYEMLRLAPRLERIGLAAILYTFDDLRAYAPIARELERLGETSSPEVVTAVLDAVEHTLSHRFLPLLDGYVEREPRRWFAARARRVRAHLRGAGREERSTERLVDLAEQAYFGSDREQAVVWLDELLLLEPHHPHGLYLKANCLKEDGRVEEALRLSGVALSGAPCNWRLHRLRGSLLWDNGHAEAAVDAYDRALALSPVDPYTWYYKGYVLYRLQRYEEALPCLDRALSLKGDSAYVYNQKAFCLEKLGRHDEAAACYRRSLRLAPTDLYTREYLGQALQVASRLEEALACFDQVLDVAPQREEALYRRADVLYDLQRWQPSEAGFAAYLELRPDSYNAWFNRGLCLRFLGRLEEASACFRESLALRPDSANARRHLEYCDGS